MTSARQRRIVLWQVRAWLLLGSQGRALAGLRRVLQTDPNDVYALATRAHLLALRGEKAAALQDLAQLVTLAPDSAVGWFNYGFLSEALDFLAQAEAAFLRALALDPQLDRAWYGLGLCLMRQRRWPEAVAALKQNTVLQPMSPHGWCQLARVYRLLNAPGEVQKIIDHLRSFEPQVAAQLEHETARGAAPPDQAWACASQRSRVAQRLH